MKKCKTIDGGEIPLPEPMIHHIQSFLTAKEAARTVVLSKSWYAAWLTRPAIDFDKLNFKNRRSKPTQLIPAAFEEFTAKTMRRYRELNLNIESFRLRVPGWGKVVESLVNKLTVNALQIGATDLDLDLRSIPQEVLHSKTLLRLSVTGCEIYGKVSFSQLKSLSLSNVIMRKSDDMVIHMIQCCVSIEELSLSNCICLDIPTPRRLTLAQVNLHEHRKLKRLYLEKLDVKNLFFTDLSSRFPCLTDLSVVRCDGYAKIKIDSTSLERITLVQTKALSAEFDVPNIRKFSYSGSGLPWLSIEGPASREWESDIAITCYDLHTRSWFLSLHKLLRKLMSQRSRISLSINLRCKGARLDYGCFEAVAEPAELENLSIDAPVTYFFALMDCLMRVVSVHNFHLIGN